MLMTLSRSLLQGRELKPFIYAQVQDQLRFIDFISERDTFVRFLCIRSFCESHVRIFEMIVRSILGWFLYNIL